MIIGPILGIFSSKLGEKTAIFPLGMGPVTGPYGSLEKSLRAPQQDACYADVTPKRLGRRVVGVHEVFRNANNTSTTRPQRVCKNFER